VNGEAVVEHGLHHAVEVGEVGLVHALVIGLVVGPFPRIDGGRAVVVVLTAVLVLAPLGVVGIGLHDDLVEAELLGLRQQLAHLAHLGISET